MRDYYATLPEPQRINNILADLGRTIYAHYQASGKYQIYVHHEEAGQVTEERLANELVEYNRLLVGFQYLGYPIGTEEIMVKRFYNDQDALRALAGDACRLDWADYLRLHSTPPSEDEFEYTGLDQSCAELQERVRRAL